MTPARPAYVFEYPDGSAGRVRGTRTSPQLTHVLIGYSARQQRWIVRRRCTAETGVHVGQVWSGVRSVREDRSLRVIPVHPAPPKPRHRRRKSLSLRA